MSQRPLEAENAFGTLLREWRSRRRVSQLDRNDLLMAAGYAAMYRATGSGPAGGGIRRPRGRGRVGRERDAADVSSARAPSAHRELPHDITLQELRVEAFFPADAATEEASKRLLGA